MKFVSIDIGIKNLSYCLFDKTIDQHSYKILKWDNIDLTEEFDHKCCNEVKNEKGELEVCGKSAKFIKDSKCYCLKHAKKNSFLLPISEFKTAFLNKQKLSNLFIIADKYKITYEKPCKKQDLIHLIQEFSNKNCFDIIEYQQASKVNLVTIGKNIQHKFDLIFNQHLSNIDTIIIENQIGPLANKMKTVQGMISQYFIMKNNHIKIDFISSSNKLKDFSHEKISYKERKKLSIQICLDIISKNFNYDEWCEMFKNHKKKDDLSDCFLQGIWYINHKLN
jgi:6-pyruvoyl-tetrahydropterin synthase